MNTAEVAVSIESATVPVPDNLFVSSLASWRDNQDVLDSAMIYLAVNVGPGVEEEVYFCSEHLELTAATKDAFRESMKVIAEDLGLDLSSNIAFTDSPNANLMAIRRMPVVIAEALAARQGGWDVIGTRPVRGKTVQKTFVPEVFTSSGHCVPMPFCGWHRPRCEDVRHVRM